MEVKEVKDKLISLIELNTFDKYDAQEIFEKVTTKNVKKFKYTKEWEKLEEFENHIQWNEEDIYRYYYAINEVEPFDLIKLIKEVIVDLNNNLSKNEKKYDYEGLWGYFEEQYLKSKEEMKAWRQKNETK